MEFEKILLFFYFSESGDLVKNGGMGGFSSDFFQMGEGTYFDMPGMWFFEVSKRHFNMCKFNNFLT